MFEAGKGEGEGQGDSVFHVEFKGGLKITTLRSWPERNQELDAQPTELARHPSHVLSNLPNNTLNWGRYSYSHFTGKDAGLERWLKQPIVFQNESFWHQVAFHYTELSLQQWMLQISRSLTFATCFIVKAQSNENCLY